MMIAAHLDATAVRVPRATVYTVLADTARTRSTRWLAMEGGVAALVGAGVLLLAPRWWPLAALLGSVVAALAGTAVRLFWGDAPGPYGACYRADGRPYPCKAQRGLPTVDRLPL